MAAAPITSLLVLLVAASAAVLHAAKCVRAFDPEAVGTDTTSVTVRLLEPLRRSLPAVRVVRLVEAPPDHATLLPFARASAAARAAELHAVLSGRRVPSADEADLRILAERYRNTHADHASHGFEQVRDHVADFALADARDLWLLAVRTALAPVVISTTVPAEWVVGVFPPGYDHGPLASREGLTVVTDHGDGTVLFRATR